MIRSVSLTYSKEWVYRALKDPILLAGWLNIPSVSTGFGPLHLFELEDWTGNAPWKTRAFILEDNRNERILLEKDEVGRNEKPRLEIRLEDHAEGCDLRLEWEDSYFDRFASEVLDPKGHLRLGLLLRVETANLSEVP